MNFLFFLFEFFFFSYLFHIFYRFEFFGLTGGISSGKSTAIKKLQRITGESAGFIDFDEFSRRLTERGSPILRILRSRFGSKIFNSDGSLDRISLGKEIFSDPKKRRQLNEIFKLPLLKLFARLSIRLFLLERRRFIILDAPLLFESGMNFLCRSTLVISVSRSVQISRLMNRDKISLTEAEQKIFSQWPIEKKISLATFSIENNGNIDEFHRKLEEFWKNYSSSNKNSRRFFSLLLPAFPSVLFSFLLTCFTAIIYYLIKSIINFVS